MPPHFTTLLLKQLTPINLTRNSSLECKTKTSQPEKIDSVIPFKDKLGGRKMGALNESILSSLRKQRVNISLTRVPYQN